MNYFFARRSRKLDRLLKPIKYWQSNFGVSLLSEFIPTDTEAFLKAGLSFSESPRYNMPPLLTSLFLIFRILETTRSNAIPLSQYSA